MVSTAVVAAATTTTAEERIQHAVSIMVLFFTALPLFVFDRELEE